ncbi:phage baseplate assembly protein V [Cetobacterium somerae]
MKIEISEIETLSIKELKITREINNHSYLKVKGLIKDEKGESYLNMIGSSIQLKVEEDSIFTGYIENINLEKTLRDSYIEIIAVSNSKKIDQQKKSRIFQNSQKTYEQNVDYMEIKEVEVQFLETQIAEKKIENPMVQYEETDFIFLKRTIGIEGSFLIPESKSNGEKIWIGKRNGESHKIENNIYTISKTENSKYLKVTLQNKFYELGDILELNEEKYFIIQSQVEYKNSFFFCTYEAIDKYRELSSIKENSQNLKLLGRVKENEDPEKKGRIQIEFEIDSDKGNEYWYKPILPYSGENMGIYYIHQKGDKVVVDFTGLEFPVVLGTVRESGTDNLKNPKEINITSLLDKIFISMDHEQIQVIKEESGIFMKEQKITTQNEDVLMQLEKEVDFQTNDGGRVSLGKEVKMKSERLEIDTNGSVQIKGGQSEIKINSSGIDLN